VLELAQARLQTRTLLRATAALEVRSGPELPEELEQHSQSLLGVDTSTSKMPQCGSNRPGSQRCASSDCSASVCLDRSCARGCSFDRYVCRVSYGDEPVWLDRLRRAVEQGSGAQSVEIRLLDLQELLHEHDTLRRRISAETRSELEKKRNDDRRREPVTAPFSPGGLEATEQRRWLVWFGLPALVAAVFVAAAFGTGQEWYLGPAVAAVISDVGVLIWLTLGTDTNRASDQAGGPRH